MRILSGVFDGMTTGTPIALQIDNVDQRSRDYSAIAAQFRPGHADLTYELKYGIRDYRGGGRSSARETAMRVAAGGVARKVLGDGVRIRGALVQIGPHRIDRARWDWDAVDDNPFFCPDPATAALWETYLSEVRKAGSSAGAVIEVVAEGVPPGLGAPIYGKLDAEIAAALMSINAVKGVEIGEGFAAAALSGEANADEMRMRDGVVDVRLQPCRRHPGRHLHRPADRGAVRGEADQLDPDAAPDRGPHRPGDRDHAPRAATTRASASAPCRWARRCWPACWPTICCATGRRTRTRPPRRGCRATERVGMNARPDGVYSVDPPGCNRNRLRTTHRRSMRSSHWRARGCGRRGWRRSACAPRPGRAPGRRSASATRWNWRSSGCAAR